MSCPVCPNQKIVTTISRPAQPQVFVFACGHKAVVNPNRGQPTERQLGDAVVTVDKRIYLEHVEEDEPRQMKVS